NPDAYGENNVGDNDGEFRVQWRSVQGMDGNGGEESGWREDGVEYMVYDRSLSTTARNLAVWDLAGVPRGDYAVRLSVRSCDTCRWVSNQRIVVVDDFMVPADADAPSIVINTGAERQVSGKNQDISIKLRNVADTSEWYMMASIEAPSARDSSVYVRVLEKSFNPMVVSPFRNTPAPSDTGLSIWHENDDSTWHVRYVGNAKGVSLNGVDKLTPTLAIRYVEGNVDFSKSPKADSTYKLGFVMDSVKVDVDSVPGFVVPAYNTQKMWDLGQDSVHLIFTTNSPFTVDASTVDSLLYMDSRGNARPPVVYVHPENYMAHVEWDGLVNKAYPSGSLVRMHVVAYEKGNEQNIISNDAEWYLDYEPTRIEISGENLNRYYMNFLGTSAGTSEIPMADYGFMFRLTGQSAYVNATIRDARGNDVRTLLEDEFVVATSSQWHTLRWNGLQDDSLVQTGDFKVHVEAKNQGKVVAVVDYPFSLDLGANLDEATTDSTKGIVADLKMDEAFEDEDGNLRYVGRADYLMRAEVNATVLPEDERMFRYRWDVYGGKQMPTLYEKT
ncbi:MAG: hypothetical protein HUK21_12935, partial [Fibrobacteraceae bacterium]|nr:hypothetical protein [Fibrobacteraceae bacterium]